LKVAVISTRGKAKNMEYFSMIICTGKERIFLKEAVEKSSKTQKCIYSKGHAQRFSTKHLFTEILHVMFLEENMDSLQCHSKWTKLHK